jgi:streptogramin lyase
MARWGLVPAALVLVATAFLAQPVSGRAQERTVRVSGTPLAFVSGRGSLWVLTCDRGCTGEARSSVGRIVRIDPRTGRVSASVKVDRPQAITVGKEGVFGVDFWRGDVYQLDPVSLRITKRLHLTLPLLPGLGEQHAFLPETISLGEGSVWVTTNRGAVARIDPKSLRLLKTVYLEPAALDAVTAGKGAAWAAAELDGVARIDSRTYRVTAKIKIEQDGRTMSVGQTLLGSGKVLAVGDWTNANVATNTNALALINPRSLHVEGVTLLPGPRLALTLGGGSLWAGRVGGTTIQRIDPSTGATVARLARDVGVALAVADGNLWTITGAGVVTRIAVT